MELEAEVIKLRRRLCEYRLARQGQIMSTHINAIDIARKYDEIVEEVKQLKYFT